MPFRIVNFDPNAATWGINFQRTVRRKNEEVLWAGYARNLGVTYMSAAGRLMGLSSLSQGLGLDVRPYVIGSSGAAPGRNQTAASKGSFGGDIFYNLTAGLRANLSINTDFAETEVEQRQYHRACHDRCKGRRPHDERIRGHLAGAGNGGGRRGAASKARRGVARRDRDP